MSFGLGISQGLSGAETGASIGSIIPGIGTGIGAAIGGGLGLIGGLFGSGPSQSELQKQAWNYEREGMRLQYEYGQKAANEAQKRNLAMWDATNFEAQRAHLEAAGLSPALFYGGAGGGATSSAGGQATQPSGPSGNPIGMGLQLQSLKLQQQQIASQTALNAAQATKAMAEAEKTRGIDTRAAEATVENLVEQTRNEKERRALIKSETRLNMANEELTDVTTNFTEAKTNEAKGLLQKTMRESEALLKQIKSMDMDNTIKRETMQNVIDQQTLQTAQMIKNLTKTTAETKAIYANINKMVADVMLSAEGNQIKWEQLQNDMVKYAGEIGIKDEQIKQGYLGVIAQAVGGLAQLGIAYHLITGKQLPKNLKIPAIE